MYIRTFVTSGYDGAGKLTSLHVVYVIFCFLFLIPWKIIVDDCLNSNVQSVVFILQRLSSFRRLYNWLCPPLPNPLGSVVPQNLGCNFCSVCSSHLQLRVLPLLNSHHYLYFLEKILIYMFPERQFNLLPKVLCYQISDYLTPNSYSFSSIKFLLPMGKLLPISFFLSSIFFFSLYFSTSDSLCEKVNENFCGNFPACVTTYLLEEQGKTLRSSPSFCIYQLLTEYY